MCNSFLLVILLLKGMNTQKQLHKVVILFWMCPTRESFNIPLCGGILESLTRTSKSHSRHWGRSILTRKRYWNILEYG
jgi:hypothetical protein